MKTNYVNPSLPARFSNDPGDPALVAAAQETKWALKSAARRKATDAAERAAQENVQKYTPKTQPRDNEGKFRRILARLKVNLGEEGTAELAKKLEATSAAQIAGNYEEMHKNGADLIKLIDAVKDGDLPRGVTENLRQGARDLSKVLAYLPLPQGDPNAKIRFSDMPPASAELVRHMVEMVKKQLGNDKAEKYVSVLESYMSGSRTMSSDEIASNMNKLLRVLA